MRGPTPDSGAGASAGSVASKVKAAPKQSSTQKHDAAMHNFLNAIGHGISGAAHAAVGMTKPSWTGTPHPTHPVAPAAPYSNPGAAAAQDGVAQLLGQTGRAGFNALTGNIAQRSAQHPLSSLTGNKANDAAPVMGPVSMKPAAPTPAPRPGPPARPAPAVMPSHATPATHAALPAAPRPVSSPTGSLGGGGGTSAPAPRAAPVLNSQGENLHDIQTRLGTQDTAGKQVDAELNPQLAAIAEQLKQLTGQHTTDVADATSHAARQQTDLQALYDRLTNFTGGVKSTQDANFANEGKSNADAFAALQNTLGQTYGGGQQTANSELDRLGLGAVSPAATAALSRDGQYLKGLTGVDAANAGANLNAHQSGFDSLMAMMQGNAQTEGVVQRGQASRDSAKTLAALNTAFNNASGTLNTQSSSIKGTRGAKVQQLVDALTHQKAADAQAAETASFNRDLAMSKLGLQQSTLTLNQQKALSQAGLTDAQIRHLGNSDNVAQQNANTNASRAAAAAAAAAAKAAGGGAKKTTPATGLDGAMSIINGYTSSPHQRDVANEFQTILHGTYNQTGQNTVGGLLKPGKPSTSDPVTMAHLADWFTRNQSKGITQQDYDTLVRALAAYSKNLGHV